jgi:hypothetical protein
MAPDCSLSVRQASNKCSAVKHHSHGSLFAVTGLALLTAVWPLAVCHDKPLFIGRTIDQNCVKDRVTPRSGSD